MEIIEKIISKNGLVFAFLFVGIIMLFSFWISKKLLRNKIPGVAIAILIGLALAFTGDKKGMADIPIFAGMAILGGSMFRDFAVVATAMSADISKIKQAGLAGIISLLIGVTVTFFIGAIIAYFMGYTDAVSMATIAAGADVIAISVATGVVKTIFTTIATPLIAKRIKLDNPHAAVVFGGLIGTTSGVVAGLAATDEKLVPYGALTATFYTGIGCLLCPSVFYLILKFLGF